MNPRIITKDELNRLIDQLINTTKVYAPVRDKTGARWAKISSSTEVYLEEVNTRDPAKGFFFPRCELLLKFDQQGCPVEPKPPGATVVFGIRPCDARGLEFIKKFYTGQDRNDPYVRARVEQTVLIGVACSQTAPTCFCLAVGGSPHSQTGLDLLLIDLGNAYLAQPVSEKGEELSRTYPEADGRSLKLASEVREKVEAEIRTRIDTEQLLAILKDGFNSAVWAELSKRCVNCGICTLLCPTCHCFDITDESVRGKVARYRVWDSCQFPFYSRHASGHNPRFSPSSRFRNRVMDKFYYTVEQVGEISCVGCGRCSANCPAGINICQTVQEIMETK